MDSAQAQIFKNELQGKVVGGWQIDGHFGHGKSAVVMKGRRGDELAAIKVFHPELVERFGKDVQLERIRRETSLVGSVHPNVIRILGGGECTSTGQLYVAMEALPWKNLKEMLPQISEAQVRPLIVQLAAAAKFLEDRGLAHRDIKPENVAINADLSSLKLLDLGVMRPFGIAGLTDMDARVFIGTLRYSSPEFLMREEVDTEDGWRALTFYQIGAVLHDMLMQKEIFYEDSEPFAVLVDAVKRKNPDVQAVDLELARLCRNCLVKDPAARLQLVSWDAFSQSDVPDTREELLRSIRARQTYYSGLGAAARGQDAEEQRLLNQKLQAASSALDYKLGRLLTTLKCFPLHSIKPEIDAPAVRATSAVHFTPDTDLGLTQTLQMTFALTMVDRNVDRASFLLDGRGQLDGQPIEESRISSGELDDVLGDKPIEEWMLRVLRNAYDAIERAAFVRA